MNRNPLTPARLAMRLIYYFAGLIGVFVVLMSFTSWGPTIIPLGGHDLDLPGTAREIFETLQSDEAGAAPGWGRRLEAALVLTTSLVVTIVLMIPITWVYMATKHVEGYNKAFVEALIILPICATSIVLLIQDSLALAFGLAALVAAVRFRVRLRDALDGIYIFAAICVGLASGVGFLGVGVVMTIFFCFASVVLWGINYGHNPVEEAKQAKELSKLERVQASGDASGDTS